MSTSPTSILLIAAIAALTFLLGYLIAFVRERVRAVHRERTIGKKAVEQSRFAIRGQLTEQLVPLLPDFPYDLADARFMGKPIDYIVFKGLGADNVSEIVFLEVKTGGSSLTPRERSIRDTVHAGRVTWADYRLPSQAQQDVS